jgi:hypothetical protein
MSRRALAMAVAVAVCLIARGATACPEPQVTGVEPCDDALEAAMINAGSGTLGSAGWAPKQMHSGVGAAAKLVPGWVPCVLLSSVATTESNWHQFGYVACGQSALTLESADCGYGIGQITSGMDGSGGFSPSQVAGDAIYNLSVSVNILISKWEYTTSVGPNDPRIAEDWYFALWGYNGLAASNNPNTHTDTLGTYYNPDNPAYPRNHYPYEEIVYGYALYPRTGSDGKPRWPSTKISHIDFTQICSSCGNPGTSITVTQPSPVHAGNCVVDWAAQYVSQSFPLASQGAVTLHSGETAAAFIELKNVGQRSWDTNTRLATTSPRDRQSLFAGPDWLAPNRLAAVTGTVAPGATFKFAFTFQAPGAPGDYGEHFGVVEEGVAWFGDPDEGGPADDQLEARLTVLAANADASLPSVDASADVPVDASADVPVDASGAGSDAAPARSDGATARPDASPIPAADGSPGMDGATAQEGDASTSSGAVTSGCGCAAANAGSLAIAAWPALLALSRARRATSGPSRWRG